MYVAALGSNFKSVCTHVPLNLYKILNSLRGEANENCFVPKGRFGSCQRSKWIINDVFVKISFIWILMTVVRFLVCYFFLIRNIIFMDLGESLIFTLRCFEWNKISDSPPPFQEPAIVCFSLYLLIVSVLLNKKSITTEPFHSDFTCQNTLLRVQICGRN